MNLVDRANRSIGCVALTVGPIIVCWCPDKTKQDSRSQGLKGPLVYWMHGYNISRHMFRCSVQHKAFGKFKFFCLINIITSGSSVLNSYIYIIYAHFIYSHFHFEGSKSFGLLDMFLLDSLCTLVIVQCTHF